MVSAHYIVGVPTMECPFLKLREHEQSWNSDHVYSTQFSLLIPFYCSQDSSEPLFSILFRNLVCCLFITAWEKKNMITKKEKKKKNHWPIFWSFNFFIFTCLIIRIHYFEEKGSIFFFYTNNTLDLIYHYKYSQTLLLIYQQNDISMCLL